MNKFTPKPGKRVGRPKLAEIQGQVTTRERILQAAESLFTERGYAAVSINEITQKVEITKPTLYHYFGDKDNLFITVLTNLMEKASPFMLDALDQEISLREKLTIVVYGYYETCQMCMTYLLKDGLDNLSGSQLAIIQSALNKNILDPLEQLFAEGIRQGELEGADPRIMAEIVISALDGLYMLHSLNNKLEFENLVDACVDIFLTGFSKKS
jgi:AcrR family transcriptional regulator